MDLRRKPVFSAPRLDSPAGQDFDWPSLDLPHAASPAGRHFDWQALGVPHPDCPAARILDWHSELLQTERQSREDQRQIDQAADTLIARLFSNLREALPDTSLKAVFDRQVDVVKARSSNLLHTLQIPIDWFGGSRGFGLSPGEVDAVWQQGTLEEKHKVLKTIEVIAERNYESVSKTIYQEWTEAQRTGNQRELVANWKRQFLQGVLFPSTATADEQAGGPAEAPPYPLAERKAERPKEVVQKTWVEFQLVDKKGNPVPDVKYKVTLPDGSIKNGVLDKRGSVRFDEIDPGQCEISFPEIDGREWRRA